MDSYLWLAGDLLLRVKEQQCLWLGGTSLVCSQLVNVYLQRQVLFVFSVYCLLCCVFNYL
jgi:hypothetical protein